MTLVWSWEDMDYIGEEEPRLLPDLWIEPDDVCAYCGLTEEASGKRLVVQCSQCSGVAHFHCAVDCAPWDTSEEDTDFVCGNCLEWTPEDAAKHAAPLTAETPMVITVPKDDDGDDFDPFDFDEERYPLP